MKYSSLVILGAALTVTAAPTSSTNNTIVKRIYDRTLCSLTNPSTGERIGGYDYLNLQGLKDDLYDNGECTAPAGPGACTRVACGNTSGIWLCNDTTEPLTTLCSTVADYVGNYYDAAPGPLGSRGIIQACTDPPNSGQVFDTMGWNVVAAYANCNKSPSLGPFHQ